MSDSILIAYASRGGSTTGVAQAIGQALTERGIPVEVRPVQEITDLSPYRAVVVGSAIQGSQWLPEALDFVRAQQTALRQKPFAAFLVCLTLALKNDKWREQAGVTSWLDPVRALVPTVSEGFFAGELDLNKVPAGQARWGFRISVWSGFWKQGDHRDWNAIRAWAQQLPVKLNL